MAKPIDIPPHEWRITLTEPKRLFIVEASRHILKCGVSRESKLHRMISDLLAYLPEVRYGTGDFGDVHPFKMKPTHRKPTKCFAYISVKVGDYDRTTRALYWDMRREERTDDQCLVVDSVFGVKKHW